MPHTPSFKRAEIWDGFEADGGSVKAISPGAVLVDLSTMIRREEVNGDHWLKFMLARSSVSWGPGGLFERDVIRLIREEDGSEIVEEYRVTGLNEERTRQTLFRGEVECEGPVFELRGESVVARTESNGLTQPDFTLLGFTATEIINAYILPAAPSYWALGTIDATDEIESFSFDFDTPLSALRRLAQITDTELEVTRPNGSSYQVHLRTTVGASGNTPLVHIGRNVRQIAKRTDAKKAVNQLWGKGGGIVGNRLTLAENAWIVSSISGDLGGGARDVVLAGGPVWRDDALNGLYLGELDRTGLQEVLDSTASSNTIRVNGLPSYSVGDRVRFYRNSSGDDLPYLNDPTSQTLYGVIPGSFAADDLVRSDNLLATPRLDGTYSGGLPSNWNDAGTGSPTLSENTNANFTQIGGKSTRVQASADGEGIVSDAVTISPTSEKPYFSALVSLWVVSGSVRIELVHSVDGVLPPPESKAWTQNAGTWIDMSINGLPLGAGTVQLRIVADGGSAEFYVDGGLLNNEADAGVFVAENAANALWLRTAQKLEEIRVPSVEYDLEPIDVSGIDPTTYPYSKIELGAEARVIDPDLANDVSLRVLSIETDVLRGVHSRIELASRPTRLTDEDIIKALRQRRGGQNDLAARFFFADLVDVPSDGSVRLKYAVDPDRARSVRYAVSTTSQPTRAAALTGTIVDATLSDGAVTGVAAYAEDVYVTVVAFSGANGTGQAGESRELRLRRETNWLRVLTERPLSIAPVSNLPTWERECDVEVGPNTRSFNVTISSLLLPRALDDQPPPTDIAGPWSYDIDVTPGTRLLHRLEDGVGATIKSNLRYDENRLLPGFQGALTATFTPYDATGGAGGAGAAGAAVVLTTRDIPDYDDIGIRACETVDRRYDNNDPGSGSVDLDLDNTANGYAFDFTPADAISLSQIRAYLKRTASPTGTVRVRVYADAAGLPGTLLVTSDTIDVSTLPTSYGSFGSANMQVFDFSIPLALTASTLYHIAFEYSNGDATNFISIEANSTGAVDELNGSWAAGPSNLPKYRIYEEVDIERYGRSAVSGTGITYVQNGDGYVETQSSSVVTLGIGDLSDVTETSPATGHILRYNGSAWVNVALDASLVAGGTFPNETFRFPGLVRIERAAGGVFAIQDAGSVSDTDLISYISFRDSADSERGWVGFGSAVTTELSVTNSAGDVRIYSVAGQIALRSGSVFAYWDGSAFWPSAASMDLGTSGNPWDVIYGGSARLVSSAGAELLRLQDSGGIGAAANPYLAFYDSSSTRIGYVGFDSTLNDLLSVYNERNGPIRVVTNADDLFRVVHFSATGSPILAFYQSGTRAFYAQYRDSDDAFRLVHDIGSGDPSWDFQSDGDFVANNGDVIATVP